MLGSIKKRLARDEDDEKTPSSWSTVSILRFSEYYLRIGFIITSTTLLGLTGYIAANIGQEHIEKIYAAAITGAIIAIIADFTVFILLSLKPKAVPAIALVDTISITLLAISIPTIINSALQSDQDVSVWRLAAAVLIERIISIAICLLSCFNNHRKSKGHLKPKIFDQKTLHSTTNSQFSPSTASPSIMVPSPARTVSV